MSIRLDDPRVSGSVILDDSSTLGTSTIQCDGASIAWSGHQASVALAFVVTSGTASVEWQGLSVSLATAINISAVKAGMRWRTHSVVLSLSNPNLFDPESESTVVSLSDPEPTPIS